MHMKYTYNKQGVNRPTSKFRNILLGSYPVSAMFYFGKLSVETEGYA